MQSLEQGSDDSSKFCAGEDSVLMRRGQLFLQRLDVLLMQRYRLPELGDTLRVLVRHFSFFRSGRRRAVAVGDLRLRQRLLLDSELVGENLAPNAIATLLSRSVDFGKALRRSGAAAHGRRCALSGRRLEVEVVHAALRLAFVKVRALDDGRWAGTAFGLSLRCERYSL